jgi:DNA-binding CsgD family transcriptional regulator
VTPAAAGTLLLAALATAQIWGSIPDLAATVLGLAGVAANAGQPRRALRLAAAANRLLAQAGAQLAPLDTAGIDLALGEARAVLDVATAAAAGLAGGRLTLDELIAEATAIPSAPEPQRGRRASSTGDVYPADLTAREVEILREVAAGLTNEQIATRLFLSAHTVQTHLRSIYSKLGGTNRTGATRFAHEHGLAPPPGPASGAAQP